MARVVKIDNAIKKRLARKEQSRNVDGRKERVYFLIVCEGEETEPNYFKALKKDLPKGTLVVADMTIQGTGKNTEGLVDFTLKYSKKFNRAFDRIWAVFDKDSFTNEQFNNAIIRAESNNINCAWSNEAFEIWFLLHFQFVNNAMSRRDYQEFLEREIMRVAGGNYEYRKNDENTYALLKRYENRDQAINWAKTLHSNFDDGRHATHNPCTLVYLLVEELFNPQSVLENIG